MTFLLAALEKYYVMNVAFLGDSVVEGFSLDLDAKNIRDVLSLIALRLGKDAADHIANHECVFVLIQNDITVPLTKDTALVDFKGYDLKIARVDIAGGISAAVVAGYTGLSATGIAAAAIAFAINAVIGIALSYVVSAISGQPSFDGDPANVQRKTSELFNGNNAIIREQGGREPWGFGNPYHGATLISSGLFTDES